VPPTDLWTVAAVPARHQNRVPRRSVTGWSGPFSLSALRNALVVSNTPPGSSSRTHRRDAKWLFGLWSRRPAGGARRRGRPPIQSPPPMVPAAAASWPAQALVDADGRRGSPRPEGETLATGPPAANHRRSLAGAGRFGGRVVLSAIRRSRAGTVATSRPWAPRGLP
jgi:hypothetical protein